MARRARLLDSGKPCVYHVVTRTTLEKFPIGDVEKDYLFSLLKKFGKRFFVDILGACCMGNHTHLVIKVWPGDRYSDEVIKTKYREIYDDDQELSEDRIQFYRDKWSSLSEFMKELKQNFTRFYNRRHNKKGYFWGDRFKSVIVEEGETLINCLAYVDLNPVRAGLVDSPEKYRWNTLGYIIQTDNQDNLFSMDFGLTGQENYSQDQKLAYYREFVYGIGVKPSKKGKSIPEKRFNQQKTQNFELSKTDRFMYHSRYFTESVIIGSKDFVSEKYKFFKSVFNHKHERKPESIAGFKGVYSLKKIPQ